MLVRIVIVIGVVAIGVAVRVVVLVIGEAVVQRVLVVVLRVQLLRQLRV